MPSAMVCYKNDTHISELLRLLSSLQGWDIHSQNVEITNINNIRNDLRDFELHFLIFTAKLNPKSLYALKIIRKNNPWTFIIYYNSLLVNQDFFKLSELGVNSCIVGNNRIVDLKKFLYKLWLDHWKRVPEKIYTTYSGLPSPRAKKIIKFLENRPITDYSVGKISEYLNISKSHFRAEFKSNFGVNFREFKQKLYVHYESELLLSNRYTPNDIYKILNYKHFTNYSRSFKKRHGECWRKLQRST
jgi:AraC-like DNA-binding protein